jgi:SAM-dependent methyltransferase
LQGPARVRLPYTYIVLSPLKGMLTTSLKRGLRLLPIAARRPVAAWLGRQRWLSARHWWATELLRDFAERDPDAYHRFLWTHHLGYAESYEVERRFGDRNINATRHELFAELRRHLGSDLATITSVFEVGCSMGYLLRHIETTVVPTATTLEGIDIDRYAVAQGDAALRSQGSRVRLQAADMSELDRVMAGRSFDLMLCAGVLMYLREQPAAAVVRAMLAHTGTLLVLSGLAAPEGDNATLAASAVRERDGTFIHNLDAMVREAGGRVVYRRWDGQRMMDGNTIYFVFAVPGTAPGAPSP